MTAYYETTRLLSDYGMSSDPFNTIHPLDQGTRYFWQEKLVPTDVPMIIVTGITGVGKSLYTAEYGHENNKDTSWLFASKGMLPSNLLKAVVQRFELDVTLAQLTLEQRKSAVVDAINAAENKYCLIIDDAHILPDETLFFIADILRFTTNLQLVLVGLPVLSDKVSMNVGEQQGGFKILYKVIAPMNKTQVRAYISELMYASGLKKRLDIADSTINKIYEASSGVARDVNKVSISYLKEILIQPKFEPVMPTSDQMFEVPETQTTKPMAGFFLMATAVVMMGVIYNVHHLYQDNNGIQHASRPVSVTAPVDQQAATTNEPVLTKNTITEDQPTVEVVELVDATIPDQSAAMQPVQVAKDNDKVITQIKNAASAAPNQADFKAKIARDTHDLMQTAGYTVQLAATRDMNEAVNWITTSPKGSKVILALRNHTPYYLLLVGSYSSMSDARQSIAQLDGKKYLNPWVRSIKQLHTDITAYRDLEANPVIEII